MSLILRKECKKDSSILTLLEAADFGCPFPLWKDCFSRCIPHKNCRTWTCWEARPRDHVFQSHPNCSSNWHFIIWRRKSKTLLWGI